MTTRGRLPKTDALTRKTQGGRFGSAEATNRQDRPHETRLSEIERKIKETSHQPLSLALAGVVERVRSLTRADGAAIAVFDQWGVVCRASNGNAPAVGSRLRPDSGLTRECFECGQVVVCEDAEKDPRVQLSIAKSLHLRSAVAVPIQAQGSVLGVIEVLSSRPSAFDSTHVAALQSTSRLLTPILAPALAQPEERAKAPRAWLAVAGATLALLALLVFFFGESHRRPMKVPSSAAVPPASDLRHNQAVMESGANARDTVEAQNPKSSVRPSRADVKPPAASPLFTVEAEKSVGTRTPELRSVPEEQGRTLASAPVPPANGGLPAASPDSEVAAKGEPFEPPILNGINKAPIPTLTLPTPTPAMPINASVANFVLDRTLKGHSGWITSIAFSPDGQRLASGGWDQTIKFWDVPTGQELSTLAGKIREVQALAFSRDGRWLATENSEDTVTLWNAAAGREIRKLSGNKPLGVLGSSWVYSIAFSPDGRWLASGVDDKTVRLWDVETGRAVRDLAALRRSIIYAAISPDGRWLASGADDKTIRIWEVSTGQEVRTLSGHKKPIYAVAFSPNGRWLASAGADKSIKLWDIATGREVHTLTGHGNVVTSLAFNADGRWLASGSWDKTIKIWNVETGREMQTLTGHTHHVYTVAFDSHGRWLASGSEDGTINLWRLGKAADQSRLKR